LLDFTSTRDLNLHFIPVDGALNGLV